MWPATWQEPATPQPPAQRAINSRQPVQEYKDVRMGDMKVAVEKQLQAEAPQIAAKALERLKSERTRALAAARIAWIDSVDQYRRRMEG
jgi:hypothetical protein